MPRISVGKARGFVQNEALLNEKVGLVQLRYRRPGRHRSRPVVSSFLYMIGRELLRIGHADRPAFWTVSEDFKNRTFATSRSAIFHIPYLDTRALT